MSNRLEWEITGKQVVDEMLEKAIGKFKSTQPITIQDVNKTIVVATQA